MIARVGTLKWYDFDVLHVAEYIPRSYALSYRDNCRHFLSIKIERH